MNEVQKPYLQTNDIGGNQKRQTLKNESLSVCIVVLVCMYMDVGIYMGGWGLFNLPDCPTKSAYKESHPSRRRGHSTKRGTSYKFFS